MVGYDDVAVARFASPPLTTIRQNGPLAGRLLAWLDRCTEAGAQVFLGDPGRSYFPKSGVERLALYRVQTTRELEDREIRETSVYRLLLTG